MTGFKNFKLTIYYIFSTTNEQIYSKCKIDYKKIW